MNELGKGLYGASGLVCGHCGYLIVLGRRAPLFPIFDGLGVLGLTVMSSCCGLKCDTNFSMN